MGGYSFESPNAQRIVQKLVTFDDARGRKNRNTTEKITYKNLHPGVYQLCFDNVLATKADKVIILQDDFEWLEEEHERAELRDYWRGKTRHAQKTELDELVDLSKKLIKELAAAERQQDYLKHRMNRH